MKAYAHSPGKNSEQDVKINYTEKYIESNRVESKEEVQVISKYVEKVETLESVVYGELAIIIALLIYVIKSWLNTRSSS